MIGEARKPRRRRNRKKQSSTATACFAAVTILIAAVLSSLVVQTQRQLAAVQQELHKTREAALQSEAKIADVEQTSATWQRVLAKADVKRNELQDQLNRTILEIKRLNHLVDTAGASRRDSQTRLEAMQSELASTKHSLERAQAEAAKLNEQVSSSNAQLSDAIAERQGLATKLQSAQADVAQLRGELNATKSELAARGLRRKQSEESEDAADISASKSAKQADPPTETLNKIRIPLGDGCEERDYLIRTLVFEASGETELGKIAVAHVILNRKRIGRWGDRIQDVVTHPWQFEPWMTRKNEIEKLSPKDPRYLDAAKIADAVLGGDSPDPTAGATHFLNPVIVRQRRGGSLPSWADGDGQPIGRHVFYFPERYLTGPQRAEAQGFQPATFPGAG